MTYRISPMKEPLTYMIKKKKISQNGYAFLNEYGNCMIIVYGESRRDSMKKYFEERGRKNENEIKKIR